MSSKRPLRTALLLSGLGVVASACSPSSSHSGNGSASTVAAATSASGATTTSATTTGVGTTAPTSQASTPPAPPPSPTLVSAVWSGAGSHAAPGDTLTLTFSQEVTVKAGLDPSTEISLPVAGNSFGAGATLAAGATPTDVVVTLGTAPNLRISGAFAVASVNSGDSTGIDMPVTATGNIVTPAGSAPVSGAVDLGGSLTEGWTAVAAMQIPRGEHTATLLNDGRILIVGGQAPIANINSTTPATVPYPVTESEIYDPVANTFTLAGSMPVPVAGTPGATIACGRAQHTATLLADGRVLIVGGWGFERADPKNPTQMLEEELSYCHLFDPKTNQFSMVTTPLTTARERHYATLLPSGKVLIAGGYNSNMPFQGQTIDLTLTSAEVFDPATDTIAAVSSSGNDMVNPRMDGIAAYDVASDQVLYSGGAMRIAPPTPGSTSTTTPAQPFKSFFRVPGGADVYDIASAKFETAPSKPAEDLRYQGTVTVPSGEIWLLGGNDDYAKAASARVEVYKGGAYAEVGSLSLSRARAACDRLGDRLIVVTGGTKYMKAPGDECANVDLVDCVTRTITTGPAMLNPRNSHTLTTLGDRVIAIGGFNGSQGLPTSEDGIPIGAAEIYSRP